MKCWEKIVGVDAHIYPHTLTNIEQHNDDHIDPKIELSKFGIIAEKYILGINGIDKYVIMPNHIHLIIFVGVSVDGSMWASTPT